MTSKISYIKKAVNYMIGGAVLAASLSSFSFAGAPKEDKALGQSVAARVLEKDKDGYYIIRNSDDLEELVNLANGKDPKAKGKLIKDTDFKKWNQIGTKEKPFEGEDNESRKITGLGPVTGLYPNCVTTIKLNKYLINVGEIKKITELCPNGIAIIKLNKDLINVGEIKKITGVCPNGIANIKLLNKDLISVGEIEKTTELCLDDIANINFNKDLISVEEIKKITELCPDGIAIIKWNKDLISVGEIKEITGLCPNGIAIIKLNEDL